MSGSKPGGMKAAKTNKHKYDDQYMKKYGMTFYAYIGSKGGSAKTDKPKGFAADRKRAARAGAVGGSRSKRNKSKKDEE